MESSRTPYFFRPCTWVYLALITLTLFTWGIGKLHLDGLTPAFVVLGVAAIKGQLIGDYFMQLKQVRSLWRWVISLWLLIPTTLIVWAFFLAAKQ